MMELLLPQSGGDIMNLVYDHCHTLMVLFNLGFNFRNWGFYVAA